MYRVHIEFQIQIKVQRESQRIDYGERRLRVSRKIEYQNSSKRSVENPDLQESWSWRKSHWRSHEAQDVKAATDWDLFLIYQVFLNSIVFLFLLYLFLFFFILELFQVVCQLLFNLVCVLDLNWKKLWISCWSSVSTEKLWISRW